MLNRRIGFRAMAMRLCWLLGLAVLAVACTGQSGSEAPPTTQLALAEGEVLLNIVTVREVSYEEADRNDSFDPVLRPSARVAFIASADVVDWWSTVIGAPAPIPDQHSVDAQTTEEILAGTSEIMVRTGADGLGQIGLLPGDYLVCAMWDPPTIVNCVDGRGFDSANGGNGVDSCRAEIQQQC